MSEDEAYQKYKEIRFEENAGQPYCPHCGSVSVGEISTRKIFKCQGCFKQFSLTSGTIFASRKLSYKKLLAAIALFALPAKGHSAISLSHELQVQYKSAFVLLHKMREAIGIAQDRRNLKGHVEVDGAYYGSYVKGPNNRSKKINKWAIKAKKGREKVMVVLRVVNGCTVPLVFKTEAASVDEVVQRIDPSAHVFADEASHWTRLYAYFASVNQINHKQVYSTAEACTNWVESFHSRVHRAMWGIHHVISGPYLLAYGREMAWREDHRKDSNAEKFRRILRAVTHHPVSRRWKGYWQRERGSLPLAYS